MRPFNDDQVLHAQRLLNDNFSRNGKLDVGEESMREIVSQVMNIPTWESKANFMFYDMRAPHIGIEFKMLGCNHRKLMDMPGKLLEFTFTRTIDGVPTDDPQKSIEFIIEMYNGAVKEFSDQCSKNIWFAAALYWDDVLAYYHETVPVLDASKLEGVWRRSKTSKKNNLNLYVTDKVTGEPVFTYLSNGQKLCIRFRVPSMDQMHVFHAVKSKVLIEVPLEDVRIIEQLYNKPMDQVVHDIASHQNRLF